MKKEKIYIGTIRINKNNDNDNQLNNSSIYQTLCPLLKIKDKYINLEWLNSFKTYSELINFLFGRKYDKSLILDTSSNSQVFVEKESLQHYYDINKHKENTTISKVKNDWLLDPRIPHGIDYGEQILIYRRNQKPNI